MTVLAGRYELAEPLGSGGMSRVHAAIDQVLGRRVAVKLIHEQLATDPIVRQRLLREARAAASFTHPNAVTVYDTGEHEGAPFIVMELVEGHTLADRIATAGPLPVEDVRRIGDDVLAALGAAHSRGLVHRDVKPANVLLPADGSGAKLADFGIAKEMRKAAEALTMTGQVLGTPRYLSPEQTAGHPATTRSDLYAVGVLCYEMLAGEPPFSGASPVAVAMAHQTDAPPSLGARRPDVPADLVEAVHRALEKDPDRRFATADEMRAALWQEGAARPAPSAAPTMVLPAADAAVAADPRSRTGRRIGAGVAALAALLVALLGGAALLWAVSERDGAAPGLGEVAAEPDRDTTPTAPTAPTPTPPADAAREEATQPEPEPEPEPAPEPEPEPEPEPQDTVERLMLDLARDPDAAGEKGEELLSKLSKLVDADAEEQPKKARELVRESRKWAEKDALDPAVADRTALLLEPLAQQATGEGEGKDKDKDRDKDDRDDD